MKVAMGAIFVKGFWSLNVALKVAIKNLYIF